MRGQSLIKKCMTKMTIVFLIILFFTYQYDATQFKKIGYTSPLYRQIKHSIYLTQSKMERELITEFNTQIYDPIMDMTEW